MSFEAHCDGIAWIDVRRGEVRMMTLALYAPPDQIFDVLGVRCPDVHPETKDL
ncbi:MAG: hypothetical protein ACO3SP_07875 [Ilumatobacteraceae bacterium]